MLTLDRINVYYGDSHILHDLSMEIGAGRVVALLGRNGAGKTTTLRAITGLTPPRDGRIALDGRDITRAPAWARAGQGIGMAPAGRRSFGSLSVRQNLALAAAAAKGRERRWPMERILALFPKLDVLMDRRAGVLSGGEQQMLKIARCLLTEPRLILLDEPSEGLAPTIVRQVLETVAALKDEGMTILICEQNVRFALKLADDAYLLEKGVIRWSGPAAEVQERPDLIELIGIGHGLAAPR